jgi:tRNA-dihydrouridine synthase B
MSAPLRKGVSGDVLRIGPHQLRNNVLLAPMAGITDAPFRELAWRYGAGYVVSEMLGVRDELWNTEKSRLRRAAVDGIEPRAVQIAGGDAQMVADAARRHVDDGAQIIDINFGCPAKKVCRKAAGSQLMADPALMVDIVRATVAAVAVPVTAKMRTGYCRENRNAPEIAHRLQEEGIAAVAVHGRTRACRFEGEAEHETVAAIKARLQVPVFANGDIRSPAAARSVLARTGVDGVMIGRAALGAPWLLGMIADPARSEPGLEEKWRVIGEHVAAMHRFYGAGRGLKVARKHVQWYLEALGFDPRAAEAPARAFNRITDPAEQVDWLAARAAAGPADLEAAA